MSFHWRSEGDRSSSTGTSDPTLSGGCGGRMDLTGEAAQRFARVWVQAALSVPRGGPSGSRIAKTIVAIGAEAEEKETTVLEISRRWAAELANLSQQRLFKWMDRLAEEGFLVCLVRGDRETGAPSRWELALPAGTEVAAFDPAQPIIAGALEDPTLDLWDQRTALYRTWMLMSDVQPVTPDDIAAKAGVGTPAIRDNLRALAAMEPPMVVKLVRHDRRGDQWWYAHPVTGELVPVKVTGNRPRSLWLRLRPSQLGPGGRKEQVAKRSGRHEGDRSEWKDKRAATNKSSRRR